MQKLLVTLAVCVAAIELQHQACDTGCRRSGYDGGRYGSERCYCYDMKPFEYITGKRLIVGGKSPLGAKDVSAYRDKEAMEEMKELFGHSSTGKLDFLEE